jgi:hypothetical protein
MATEILINDGGAPARIIPFTMKAATTCTAGMALSLHSDGTVVPADTDLGAAGGQAFIGIALTAAVAGGIVNVITGSGVVVMALCTAENLGVGLELSAAAGTLDAYTGAYPASGQPVAVTLEGTGAGLTKVLLL